ncbi:MAG: PASTA domain-containing protein, partial [Streptococcaceae bacterium]|nr:PASTA domain-containing protein [Streptococcaceae bacterium]
MAVKTGTAQIAAPTGGYMTGDQDYIYSAVAMYPPQNPDFIFYMNIKIPSSPWYLGFISDVANPMMTQAESMKASLQNISNTGDQGTITLKDYKNNNSGDTADALRRELLAPVLVGMGSNIKAQSISSGTKVGTNTRLLLLTDGDQIMPDMYSWSKDQVDQVANWYGLKINYEGSGNSVVKQSITIGNTVKNGQTITITMG